MSTTLSKVASADTRAPKSTVLVLDLHKSYLVNMKPHVLASAVDMDDAPLGSRVPRGLRLQ